MENQEKIVKIIEEKLATIGEIGEKGLDATASYVVMTGVANSIGCLLGAVGLWIVSGYSFKKFIKFKQQDYKGEETAFSMIASLATGLSGLILFANFMSYIPQIINPIGYMISQALIK